MKYRYIHMLSTRPRYIRRYLYKTWCIHLRVLYGICMYQPVLFLSCNRRGFGIFFISKGEDGDGKIKQFLKCSYFIQFIYLLIFNFNIVVAVPSFALGILRYIIWCKQKMCGILNYSLVHKI